MKLERGQVAVVTGAASGMGRSLALQLAAKGVSLALCDVDMAALAVTVKMARAVDSALVVTEHEVDVADEAQVLVFRDEVLAQHKGGVQLLFNNAGVACDGRLVFLPSNSAEEIAAVRKGWDRCFNIDFFGVLHCVRAFLPALQASTEAYVVNTSSINAIWTWPEHSAYSSAKAAVQGLTESLMIECMVKAPHVHVACVHPGGVRTDSELQLPALPNCSRRNCVLTRALKLPQSRATASCRVRMRKDPRSPTARPSSPRPSTKLSISRPTRR